MRDRDLLAAEVTETTLGTELPVEVIRHMRRDRVLQSFVDNIWSEMGRCINCHSPERNQRQVREHGEQISWIVPRDPAATLEKLIESGNIDTDNPDERSSWWHGADRNEQKSCGTREMSNYRMAATWSESISTRRAKRQKTETTSSAIPNSTGRSKSTVNGAQAISRPRSFTHPRLIRLENRR